MKKLILATAGILMGALVLPAQQQVVKSAERLVKEGATPAKVLEAITPAFSDPATAKDANTYFIPGKAFFDEYDQLLGLQQFNKLPEGGEAAMVDDLLQGYGLFMKALPLDTVVDAKGKVKTKHSKKIISTLAGHMSDYDRVAIIAFNLPEYNKAYDAWQVYIDMAQNPAITSKLPQVPADSVIGKMYYNMGVAAYQAGNMENALKSFTGSVRHDNKTKDAYDNAIQCAANLNNNELAFELSREAETLFGKEDPKYQVFMINYYLNNKEFDKAFTAIDQAIANNPGNAQFYVVKGILYDNDSKADEARKMFEKALELEPENAFALYNMGRSICEEAYRVSDAAPTTPVESEKYYNEKIVPLFKKAADYLERSWNINSENPDVLNYLENVYYNLHDEKMLNDVKARKQ